MATNKNGKQLPKGIRQRSNGSFEVRVKRNGESHSVYAATLTEAKKKKSEMEYKLDHGIFVDKGRISFDKWYNTWMEEYKKNTVKAGTYYSYYKCYDSCLKGTLGNKNLTAIRGEHIQKLYNDMVSEGYANSTIKVISAILNGCFKQALKNGLIERNPVELATLPRQTEKHERQAMTREQQELFMDYAKDSYLFNYFAVMLRTGMRSGEMRGLKFSDIDKKENVIHVRRTLRYIEHEGYIEDTPKTKTSARDIPLTPDILALLEAQKHYWNFKVENMNRYLFCNEKGKPLSRERVQSEIDRITKRIREDGYDFPRITNHVFRHSFATRAIESGMQPQVLKTILGHSSLSMTMDLYSHVMPDTKQEAMQEIASAF